MPAVRREIGFAISASVIIGWKSPVKKMKIIQLVIKRRKRRRYLFSSIFNVRAMLRLTTDYSENKNTLTMEKKDQIHRQ